MHSGCWVGAVFSLLVWPRGWRRWWCYREAVSTTTAERDTYIRAATFPASRIALVWWMSSLKSEGGARKRVITIKDAATD